MSQVFSVEGLDAYINVEEDDATRHVVLVFETPHNSMAIKVDAGDLARALVSASPTFATGLGEVAQRAILSVLDRDNN